MPKYLAIFTCAENSANHLAWKKMSPAEQSERMISGYLALDKWLEKYDDQIEFDGGSLGDRTKIVDPNGIHEVPSQKGRFLIITAESHEQAAQIFSNHPHFVFFPGDAVEILECQN